MNEKLSAQSERYREELLRLYRSRKADQPEEIPPEEPPEIPPEETPEIPPEETPEIPVYIRPVTDWQEQADYENRNTAEGYLRVVTAAADSAYPVPDARVSVFTRIGGRLHLNYLMHTGENGETPTVALPAPPAGLSQEPENERPFAACEVRIAAKGFFPTRAGDVHIFAGITTRQTFQLVPLPLYAEPQDADIDPNSVGRTGDCQEGGVPC